MAKIVLQVSGMKCGGCEKTVQEAAQEVPGVMSATASHKAASVEVEYDDAKTNPDAIRKAISGKGYPVT
jgi:copper chaperone